MMVPPRPRAVRKYKGGRKRTYKSVQCLLYVVTIVSLAWMVGFFAVFWWHQETNQGTNGDTSAVPGTKNGMLDGGNRMDKNHAYSTPLLIFTCSRDNYLSETLEYVYKSIGQPCRFGCPIIISEDGRHPEIESVVLEYKSKFEARGIPLEHIHHETNLRGSNHDSAYQALAKHYGWALTKVFNGKVDEKKNYPIPQRVIILEEDIRVANDFFSYMEATSKLLDSDPTLLAVSAFNDNGHHAKDPKRLLRSDFFPGLGWMMTRELWKRELEVKWPTGYWDDWLREPGQRKGRQVIRPEISRTYHFGTKGGASSNQFGTIMEKIHLNEQPIHWEKEDLSYLKDSIYEKDYNALVMSSTPASTLDDAMELIQTGNTRLGYNNFAEFHDLANRLEIMDDEKAMIPRTAYKGIVEIRPHDEYLLFLYPTKNG